MYQLKKIISLLFLIFCLNMVNITQVLPNETTSKMFLQSINSATESSEFIIASRVNPSIIRADSQIYILNEVFPYKFGISELQPIAISAYFPLFDDNVRIKSGINGIFNSVFNQYAIDFSIGYKISNNMSIGTGFEYNNLSISKSNMYSSYGFTFGTLFNLSNIVDFGLSLRFADKFEENEFGMEQIYCGLGLNLTENLMSDVGLKRNSYDNFGFYFRTKYFVSNPIAFRIGYQTTPNTVELGVLLAINTNITFTVNIEKSEYLNYNSFIQLGIKL